MNAVTWNLRGRDIDLTQPAAVYASVGGQLRIIASNEPARQAGIAHGFTISAALALIESLALFERSPSTEDAYLDAFADWAGQFTPSVSQQSREGLLLEVRASLKLFGGLDVIRRRLTEELQRRSLRFWIGVAPTPLAALWSARCGNTDCLKPGRLASHLGSLPLAATGWSETILKRLQEMGIRTVGECLRLPRDGFARRAGKVYLDDLDRAMGIRPDPRKVHRKLDPLVWTMNFAHETCDKSVIGKALEAGIGSLARDLSRGQKQIRQLQIGFAYIRGIPDIVSFNFVDPLYSASSLLSPLIVRLDSIRLRGAVTAITLETGPLLPACMDPGSLFDNPEGQAVSSESHAVLIECLRGRFGREGVYGLKLHAEHRPELAFQRLTESLMHSAERDVPPAVECARPLWLLQEPMPLSGDALRSLVRSEPDLGPERIESGWWDGADVQRDYYRVTTGAGERWWVYRDRVTREWRLHGVFG